MPKADTLSILKRVEIMFDEMQVRGGNVYVVERTSFRTQSDKAISKTWEFALDPFARDGSNHLHSPHDKGFTEFGIKVPPSTI